MARLKLIAFFLALVMAIQMLPLAQIGYALSSNQWTEELPHNAPEKAGKGYDEDFFVDPYLPPTQYRLVCNLIDSKGSIYIHTSEKIPSNHSTDVVTPPPDVQA